MSNSKVIEQQSGKSSKLGELDIIKWYQKPVRNPPYIYNRVIFEWVRHEKAKFTQQAKITALHSQLAFEGNEVRVKSVVTLQGADISPQQTNKKLEEKNLYIVFCEWDERQPLRVSHSPLCVIIFLRTRLIWLPIV